MNYNTIFKALLICCIANPLLLQAKMPPRLNTGNVVGVLATTGIHGLSATFAWQHLYNKEYPAAVFMGGITLLIHHANKMVIEDIFDAPKQLKKKSTPRY